MHPHMHQVAWQIMTEEESSAIDTHLTNLDDASLLHHIRHGRHEAFAALVNRHAKRFYRIAYRLVFDKNDAEDIVQEAFLKLWRKPQLWDQGRQAQFTTWFYTVVTNLCLDYNKKKRPTIMTEHRELVDNQPGQEALVQQRQQQALLDRCIRELPVRQQLALNLCFYEGLSNEEAARIIGVTVKAVQSLLIRAKTTLKKKVTHHADRG
jgi:RNA polymerase sigma-70 factor (ECF subfamily)